MNELFAQGGKGSVGIQTNKQSIARVFGIKQNEVSYLKVGETVTDYKVVYDKLTQTSWANLEATGSIMSWVIGDTLLSLVTTTGTFKLYMADRSKLTTDLITKVSGGASSATAYGQGANFSTLTKLLGHQSDSGNYFGAQDFTFNPFTREVYTLTLSGGSNNDLATINQFPLDGREKQTTSTAFTSPASNQVGHQGLGFEPLVDDFRLWSTAYRNSPSVYTGRHAVRFGFVTGGAITDPEIYLLFGTDFVDSTSCTPCVSACGRYLLAHGTKVGGNYDTRIRVFSLETLRSSGPGDYSDAFLHEFSTSGLVGKDYPLQGLACDGSCVAAIAGNAAINQNKKLYWYDLWTGKPIFKDDSFNVGRTASAGDGAGTRYEPEGLEFIKDGNSYQLVLGIVSGNTGARVTRLYVADKPLERFFRGLLIPNAVTPGGEVGNVFSGRYTPSIVLRVNASAAVISGTPFYTMVGRVVTVNMRIDVTPIAGNTVCELAIDLPYASNFKVTSDLVGFARSNSGVSQQEGMLFADSATDVAVLRFIPTGIAAYAMFISFNYAIK